MSDRPTSIPPIIRSILERPSLAAGLVFIVLTLIFFARAIGGDFMVRDAYHEYFTLRLLAGFFRHGHLPLWDPYPNLGAPLAGAGYPGIFYPVNLVLGLLPLPAGMALKLYVLAHFAAAGAGMAYFLRRAECGSAGAYAGAVGYAFCGHLVSQHYALNLLPGFALMPLAAGLALQAGREAAWRAQLAAGAATGLILLGGDPQGFALAVIVCAAMTLAAGTESGAAGPGWRRTGLGLAVYAAAALAMGAAELVPMITVFRESGRSGGLPFEDASCWSLAPLRLLELVLARPLGNAWPEHRWWGGFLGERCFPLPLTVSPYLGMGTAAGCVLAWRARAGRRGLRLLLAVMAALAALLALGRHFPLYRFLFDYLPGFGSFRYPEKYLGPVSFALAALAGLGIDGWARSAGAGRPARFRGAGAVLLATGLMGTGLYLGRGALAGAVAPLLREGVPPGVTPEGAAGDVIAALVRSGLMLSITLAALAAGARRGGAWRLLPAAALFADLAWANAGLAPTAPDLYRMKSRFAEAIMAHEAAEDAAQGTPPAERFCAEGRVLPCYSPRSPRIFRDPFMPAPDELTYEQTRRWERDTLKPNLGLIEGFEDFAGISVAASARYDWMAHEVATFDRLPLFGVKYAIVPESEAAQAGATVLDRYQGAALLEFAQTWPRAYWVSGYLEVPGEAQLAAAFARNDFRRSVIIESPEGSSGPGPEQGPGAPLVTAQVTERSPNRLTVKVAAPSPGWLVLNDAYYQGWKAEVDGRAAEIARANGLVRAVRVGPGTHEVRFSYSPPGLFGGIGLSLAAAICCLFCCRRRARASDDRSGR